MADFPINNKSNTRRVRSHDGSWITVHTSGTWRPKRRISGFHVVVGILIALGVTLSIGYNIAQISTRNTYYNCHVIDKDRSYNSRDGKSDMRIYTDNCGTFRIKDTIFGNVNFDTADLYSSIMVDRNYDFNTRGFRFGLFNGFPIILEATPS